MNVPDASKYGANKEKRLTERGEWLKLFSEKTGMKIGFIAFKLTGISTSDLHFLSKRCDEYAAQGKPWAKCFWGSLKVKKSPAFAEPF